MKVGRSEGRVRTVPSCRRDPPPPTLPAAAPRGGALVRPRGGVLVQPLHIRHSPTLKARTLEGRTLKTLTLKTLTLEG